MDHVTHITREQTLDMIHREFATAAQAAGLGNEGMVRVCARRAAGAAISYWRQTHRRVGWGIDALHQLQGLSAERTLPQPVREAATRLSTRVTPQFTSGFPTDPVEDSRIIINHLLEIS
jgi:hypothetical protein